jgi:hypothetical protein
VNDKADVTLVYPHTKRDRRYDHLNFVFHPASLDFLSAGIG